MVVVVVVVFSHTLTILYACIISIYKYDYMGGKIDMYKRDRDNSDGGWW